MIYFTTASQSSRVRYGALAWQIGVNESPNAPQRIGEATEVGMTVHGLAIWQLHVRGTDVPGLWVVVDGRFVGVEEASV
jgi:hypothetical protein